ncbi:ent-kaurene oxidase [Colletotrichum higginsianum]|uniref:Ent-kaurene oxidase n=1 Tax=Colletotrichum higginsianum (strain IMI 349063) TaxID=759273 RepID=H1VCS0_COLHI|nr:ent-kaurene oxidase [Colletotrichum higginsianum]
MSSQEAAPLVALGASAGLWQAALTLLVTLVVGYLAKTSLSSNSLSKIPLVGLEIGDEEKRRLAYLGGAKNIYQQGYQKFKDGIFQITTSRTVPVVIVHPRFLNELSKLPPQILSADAAVNEGMEAKYTQLWTIPVVPHAIKTMLTPGLVRLTEIVAEELQEAFSRELPDCKDWSSVQVHPTLLRIVAAGAGRVFVGPELCRDEKYLDSSINFTGDVMTARNAVQQMRQWLRPFLAHRLPEVQRLSQHRAEAEEFLRPVILKRRKMMADPDQERPDDLLSWLMEAQATSGKGSDRDLAEQQLGIGFAAIHTTTLTGTNAFYNLAAMPDVAAELRDEVSTVLAENKGAFTTKALHEMKKLDSFLKETLRCHPFVFATFQRKALKDITLSNGQVIPAGTTIECPNYAVSHDEALFEDADEFDAFRFYKLREKAALERTPDQTSDASMQNQFASVSQNSLAFGYGREACPGRFFSANELKVIFSIALLQYEMKLAEGSEGRYPNMEFGQLASSPRSPSLPVHAFDSMRLSRLSTLLTRVMEQ